MKGGLNLHRPYLAEPRRKETRAMVVQMRMIIFVILGLLSLCLAPVLAQVSSPDLVAQAKKEGGVTWYTTVSIPESKQFIDMFEKQYPFIKVDLLRSGSGALVNRVITSTQRRTTPPTFCTGCPPGVGSP